MAYVPLTYMDPKQVESGIAKALQELAPEVVRIRYSFAEDWTGDPSIYYRIVISDEAAKKSDLSPLSQKTTDVLRREINALESGINDYFNFRSLSETVDMPEPEWA